MAGLFPRGGRHRVPGGRRGQGEVHGDVGALCLGLRLAAPSLAAHLLGHQDQGSEGLLPLDVQIVKSQGVLKVNYGIN